MGKFGKPEKSLRVTKKEEMVGCGVLAPFRWFYSIFLSSQKQYRMNKVVSKKEIQLWIQIFRKEGFEVSQVYGELVDDLVSRSKIEDCKFH